MALFENYERRIGKINAVLAQYGLESVEQCRELCQSKGFDPYEIAKSIQPICFENVCWAYCVGAAIAIKSGVKNAAEAAKMIGVGLQSFCLDGSVAEDRKVGLGHGNLGAMLLSDDTKCFAFLAGHESFAAAEGAIGIVKNANKARKEPLRVILNGLGKDAAQIISRINGFTYVQTQFDYFTGALKLTEEMCPLTEEMFARDALIFDGSQIEEVWLCHKDGSPYVGMQCKGFPNFGIWSVKDAPFVCLEPWAGRCDDRGFDEDISRKKGIICLQEKELFVKSYKIIAV